MRKFVIVCFIVGSVSAAQASNRREFLRSASAAALVPFVPSVPEWLIGPDDVYTIEARASLEAARRVAAEVPATYVRDGRITLSAPPAQALVLLSESRLLLRLGPSWALIDQRIDGSDISTVIDLVTFHSEIARHSRVSAFKRGAAPEVVKHDLISHGRSTAHRPVPNPQGSFRQFTAYQREARQRLQRR